MVPSFIHDKTGRHQSAKEIIDRSDSEIVVKHGGKRKGSGRPKKAKTTTIRVPTKYIKAIKEWLRGRLSPEQEKE